MATAMKDGPDRWAAHLGSAAKSEITIEVRMIRETAEKIAAREASRIEMLNPGCDDLPRGRSGDGGVESAWAVCGRRARLNRCPAPRSSATSVRHSVRPRSASPARRNLGSGRATVRLSGGFLRLVSTAPEAEELYERIVALARPVGGETPGFPTVSAEELLTGDHAPDLADGPFVVLSAEGPVRGRAEDRIVAWLDAPNPALGDECPRTLL